MNSGPSLKLGKYIFQLKKVDFKNIEHHVIFFFFFFALQTYLFKCVGKEWGNGGFSITVLQHFQALQDLRGPAADTVIICQNATSR